MKRQLRAIAVRLAPHVRSALVLLGAVSAVSLAAQSVVQIGVLGLPLAIGGILAVGWVTTHAACSIRRSWRELRARKADDDD